MPRTHVLTLQGDSIGRFNGQTCDQLCRIIRDPGNIAWLIIGPDRTVHEVSAGRSLKRCRDAEVIAVTLGAMVEMCVQSHCLNRLSKALACAERLSASPGHLESLGRNHGFQLPRGVCEILDQQLAAKHSDVLI